MTSGCSAGLGVDHLSSGNWGRLFIPKLKGREYQALSVDFFFSHRGICTVYAQVTQCQTHPVFNSPNLKLTQRQIHPMCKSPNVHWVTLRLGDFKIGWVGHWVTWVGTICTMSYGQRTLQLAEFVPDKKKKLDFRDPLTIVYSANALAGKIFLFSILPEHPPPPTIISEPILKTHLFFSP